MLSVVVHIKLNIINSLGGVTKQMTKLILFNLKQKKTNYIYIYSNTQTVIVIIK